MELVRLQVHGNAYEVATCRPVEVGLLPPLLGPKVGGHTQSHETVCSNSKKWQFFD
jgi:hypothetical protein